MTATLRRTLPVLGIVLTLVALAAPPTAATVTGDYLEARTADVYTGPCFANGEMGLRGKEAILAWRVADGSWNGVDLANLSVVAVVTASDTLGDVALQPELDGAVRSVLVVDERADPTQSEALVAMARELGGVLLEDVQAVETAPIELAIDSLDGVARLSAGELAALSTRALTPHDDHCGNEIVFYPPLTPGVSATPAVTLRHSYRGDRLGRSWSSPDQRSAFVGTFER